MTMIETSNTGTVTNTSTITADSGSNTLSASAEFVNDGLIRVISGATETMTAPLVSGTGTMQIATGGQLFLNVGAIEATQTIVFNDATGLLTLDLGTIGGFDATIDGFQAGDTIKVQTTSAATFSQSGSVVLVIESGVTLGGLTFENVAEATLAVGTSGALVDQVACFAAGTRIRTARGEVKVEALRVGDEVLTVSGARQSIEWIGYRRVDCLHHPARERVWPIRIAPHAFGNGRPSRAVFMSPDHSVFVEGVLIPVKFLVNDTTIVQVEVDRIDYYHIELRQHDVVLAEGLPAETYLETGGRHAFANAGDAVQLHPDFEPDPARVGMVWRSFGYAPLLGSNGELDRVRTKLALQATLMSASPGKGLRSGAARMRRSGCSAPRPVG
jgi:Hint domain